MRVPFDDMHQKRLFILHLENVSVESPLVRRILIQVWLRSPLMNSIYISLLRMERLGSSFWRTT